MPQRSATKTPLQNKQLVPPSSRLYNIPLPTPAVRIRRVVKAIKLHSGSALSDVKYFYTPSNNPIRKDSRDERACEEGGHDSLSKIKNGAKSNLTLAGQKRKASGAQVFSV